MKEIILIVNGMMCGGCENRVKNAIKNIECVKNVTADHHHQVMNLYFESVAIVIYFIKLGRYIDGISKDKTREAIQKLVKITPNKAVIKKDGSLKEVTLYNN